MVIDTSAVVLISIVDGVSIAANSAKVLTATRYYNALGINIAKILLNLAY